MSEPVYSNKHTGDVAYAMGLDGTPAPDWVKADVRFFRSYKAGLDARAKDTKRNPTPRPRPPRKVSRAGRRLATSSKTQGKRAAAYTGRAFSPAAAARRTLAAPAAKLARAGDAGGLLLALVIYPVALATIKYGADGPGVWFKAKWLNQPTNQPPTKPGLPNHVPAPGRPRRRPRVPTSHAPDRRGRQ